MINDQIVKSASNATSTIKARQSVVVHIHTKNNKGNLKINDL